LAFDGLELDTHGYLGAWQELNRQATLPHCISSLEGNGSLDNLRRLVGKSSAAYKGMVFQDSDIHKTLEAVAWVLGQHETPELRAFLDSTAILLEEAQDDDGYLNSWFQGVKPEQRWQDVCWGHEMYCAGYLVQAAVAAARAAGHERLLNVARGFADLLVRRFGDNGIEGICGHPEIETALVELARLTGEKTYARLASRMIELRGRGLLGESAFGRQYFQDHLPVREASTASGHAVRQPYLAAGITDVYLEQGDSSLLEAMERLWWDLFTTKTYITGGHGSRHRAESFGDPYELPPDRAYTEPARRSPAANGTGGCFSPPARVPTPMKWSARSTTPLPWGLPRTGGASSTRTRCSCVRGTMGQPRTLRLSDCRGTPARAAHRILRVWRPSFQHYVATQDDSGIQLHLFASGRIKASGPFGDVELEVQTDYPWDGRVSINVVAAGTGPWTLSIRLPAWCESTTLDADGSPREPGADQLGYLRLDESWTPGATVTVDFAMPTRLVRAHPYVDAVRGCGALTRGPLVYCVEEGDVGDSTSIDDIALDVDKLPTPVSDGETAVAPVVLEGPVHVFATPAHAPLYQAVGTFETSRSRTRTTVRAIPYARWANRGARAMRVWLPLAED
jgi:DUF1680 family protein